MTHEPLLAGVDIGTTNIKAIIFKPNGQSVAEASAPTPTHYPRPGWAYYDPAELWQATASALRQVTGQLAKPEQIASIAVASMGEAAAPLDRHGQPTYQAIAWFDQRAQAQAEWLARTIGSDRLFSLTGLSLQLIFGLCKMLWFKENQPEAFVRSARWLNMADYIAYRLCGVPATDYSLASRMLTLDIQRLAWAEDLIKEVGLPPSLFAPLQPSGTRLGPITPEAAEATGLPQSVQVATGGHDHVCGALAVGVIKPGVILNSLGTAEAIFVPLARPVTDPNMGRQGYTQGAHVVADHYYVFGAVSTSGASVEWWRKVLGEAIDYPRLIAEAGQVPPGSLGVCFLPHLGLANPPYEEMRGRGAFIGLTTDVRQGVMFRAILEGLAYEARRSLAGLLTYPEVAPLQAIYATGGNTRNSLLMQIKATVLNRPIMVVEVAEAVSLGAAILGGLGAGVYPDVPSAIAALDYAQTLVEPIADQTSLYEAYYRRVYEQLYPVLQPLHRVIYQIEAGAE